MTSRWRPIPFQHGLHCAAKPEVDQRHRRNPAAGVQLQQQVAHRQWRSTTNFIQFTDVASVVRDKDNALPENVTVESSQGANAPPACIPLSLSGWDMLYLTGTMRVESASTFGDAVR